MAMKQVIVLRKDLRMSAGKAVAQGAHASLGSFLATQGAGKKKWISAWKKTGVTKVALSVEDEDALLGVVETAKSLGLPYGLVRDEGRTEIDPGTLTCCALGPAPEELIDQVTGSLRLYR